MASCRPAISPSVRASNAVTSSGPETKTHRPVEKLGGFAGDEAEVGRVDALVSWPPASRARGSGGFSRVAMTRCIRGGRCSNRKADVRSIGSASRNVVVVKDEDEAFREGGDLVDQGLSGAFRWRRLRGLERIQHTRANARRNPFDFTQVKRLQSRDEIGQKACEVVIPFIQRQPGNFGRMRAEG